MGLLSSSARMQPSARGRLRAADRCAIEFAGNHFRHSQRLQVAPRPILLAYVYTRAAACEVPARADARSGPSRGEAAARCALRAQIHNSIFKIQNYEIGQQPAECPLATLRSCGPPPPPGCGPLRPHGRRFAIVAVARPFRLAPPAISRTRTPRGSSLSCGAASTHRTPPC